MSFAISGLAKTERTPAEVENKQNLKGIVLRPFSMETETEETFLCLAHFFKQSSSSCITHYLGKRI